MMDRYKQLVDMVKSYEKDYRKFYEKGNKTAGIRLRKHMQELRSYAKDIRDEVQEIKQRWEED
ncbi:MAG: histone H1 [Candidatus Kapaibacterium sp.]